MIEAHIFKYISSKEKYNKFKDLLQDKFFTPYTDFIFTEMEHVFEIQDTINWNDFVSYLCLKHPDISGSRLDMYKEIVQQIQKVEEKELHSDLIKSFIEREAAGRIYSVSDSLFSGTGKYSLDDIKNILTDYSHDIEAIDDHAKHFVTKDPMALKTAVTSAGGLNWRLEELNVSLGPLPHSSLVLFCARPDGGKTTMLISEAGHMAHQLQDEESILFVCNEEPGENVMVRLVCSVAGITLAEYDKDPHTAYDKYLTAAGGDRIDVYYDEDCSTNDVELLLENRNIKLLCIDQLRKLRHGPHRSSEQEYQRLSRLFGWARSIGSRYRIPVLCVHQCDGTAEGLKYLHMGQIHGSNTDIQGECDAIVMIGRAHGEELERGISIPKNKFPGADPARRNSIWDVKIDRDLGRFVSGL